MAYLLDTNIVTAIIKRNPKITTKLEIATRHQQKLFISGMTYYEIWIIHEIIINTEQQNNQSPNLENS